MGICTREFMFTICNKEGKEVMLDEQDARDVLMDLKGFFPEPAPLPVAMPLAAKSPMFSITPEVTQKLKDIVVVLREPMPAPNSLSTSPKIRAIRELREFAGLGLKEAKDVVEAVMYTLGYNKATYEKLSPECILLRELLIAAATRL